MLYQGCEPSRQGFNDLRRGDTEREFAGHIEAIIEKDLANSISTSCHAARVLPVDAGMYLKKLVRSWRRFGERGIWLPSGLVQRMLERCLEYCTRMILL
jgi:hypothetical protein